MHCPELKIVANIYLLLIAGLRFTVDFRFRFRSTNGHNLRVQRSKSNCGTVGQCSACGTYNSPSQSCVVSSKTPSTTRYGLDVFYELDF